MRDGPFRLVLQTRLSAGAWELLLQECLAGSVRFAAMLDIFRITAEEQVLRP